MPFTFTRDLPFKQSRSRVKNQTHFALRQIGSQVAEDEAESLRGYYLPNKYYHSALKFNTRALDKPRIAGAEHREVFFIGRTGSGKSAILEMIRQNSKDSGRVISINNDDIAIQLLLRSPEITAIPSFLQPLLFKCLWKYVMLTNILKRVHGASLEGWNQFLFSEDEETRRLFQKFDEIVPNQRTMAQQVLAFIRVAKSAESLSDLESSKASERLHGIFRFLLDFEERKLQQHIAHKYVHILVDDLDREWSGREENVLLIRALFDCIIDLTRRHNSSLRFIVALRTDIFSQINFHQREKIREYVTEIKWTPYDLERLVEMRLRTFWNIPSSKDVWSVFPNEIPAGPLLMPTYKYLISRTLWRPRDIINFVNLCIDQSQSRNAKAISIGDVLAAEKIYSRQRAEALVDEWKYTYPDVHSWIDIFAGTKSAYSLAELEQIGCTKRIYDCLFKMGFLGFRQSGPASRLVFSFSSDYESPIPNRDLVVNRSFHMSLLARAEQLGQTIEAVADDSDGEVVENIENASVSVDEAVPSKAQNTQVLERRNKFSDLNDSDATESNYETVNNRVFVCYAKASSASFDFADRIGKLLDSFMAQRYLSYFIDRDITEGEKWSERIKAELETSQIAVVLLSEAFFSSKYVREVEMPEILKRHQNGSLRLIPVLVEDHPLIDHLEFRFPCPVEGPDNIRIAELQFINKTCYSDLGESEKKLVSDKVAKSIVEYFRTER